MMESLAEGLNVSLARHADQAAFVPCSSCRLTAVPAAAQDGSVVIACNTQQPYRHCLELPSTSAGVDVRVQGISFEHYSKSVANNYCIFAQVGWQLCLVSGQFLLCELTATNIVSSDLSGCASVLSFTFLTLAMSCWLQAGQLTLERCDISSSSGVGVGVEGASVTVQQCTIHNCERHGVAAFGSLDGE